MITFLKNFIKYLLCIMFINLFFFKNIANTKYIRDTEIEKILYAWTKPILNIAGLEENNLKIHIIADKRINAFVTCNF